MKEPEDRAEADAVVLEELCAEHIQSAIGGVANLNGSAEPLDVDHSDIETTRAPEWNPADTLVFSSC